MSVKSLIRYLSNSLTCNTDELASDELQQAKRCLLEAQSNVEYWKAQVDYNQKRVDRLTVFLKF